MSAASPTPNRLRPYWAWIRVSSPTASIVTAVATARCAQFRRWLTPAREYRAFTKPAVSSARPASTGSSQTRPS